MRGPGCAQEASGRPASSRLGPERVVFFFSPSVGAAASAFRQAHASTALLDDLTRLVGKEEAGGWVVGFAFASEPGDGQ